MKALGEAREEGLDLARDRTWPAGGSPRDGIHFPSHCGLESKAEYFKVSNTLLLCIIDLKRDDWLFGQCLSIDGTFALAPLDDHYAPIVEGQSGQYSRLDSL